ncbi:hypothetical protein MSSIH_0127 [Methanosarcina siciliae HI350]|uniref:DUF5320 domain-containing protein n=3 Tax=Methanosarcina siciliae TaxID=38027 RepID=A0A0E3P9W5_9EURY|nr:DUF5320 domain-containing protein [Methanosarcina siciliae]AKB30817.1 hypothetical protein MSSIH_0127 [Methanosarcina siciliae HI350]
MPHGDRTGPMGQGSKTGRAMGYCSGSDEPGYKTVTPVGAGRRAGRGMNRKAGCGAGRGLGHRRTPGSGKSGQFASRGEYSGYYYPAPSQTGAESDIDFLEDRIKALKQELDKLTENLKNFQSQENDKKE